MKQVEGGVTAPKGFAASGVAAGVKSGSTKLDCALLVSDIQAVVAGAFTTNVVKAAPVEWCRSICALGSSRGVFINSGNANACTGAPGSANTQATAKAVADGLGTAPEEICICSTGVIGVQLPMERILTGVKGCLAELSDDGGEKAARAIMTTDTRPKETAVEILLGGVPVRIGAMAKGSGMIAPNMATMIAIVTTDAHIDADVLTPLLRDATNASFNRICVDNDMSTNDTVLCFANGRSGAARLTHGAPEFQIFSEALVSVCQDMAKALVRDGEGATKFVEIHVSGANTNDDAMTVARAIAMSDLCKTAFFGQDPNWGRIACAAGYSGIAFRPDALNIWVDSVQLAKDGAAATYEEADAAAVMKQPSFIIRVETGAGPGAAVFWTSDLSYDYVRINADYRS